MEKYFVIEDYGYFQDVIHECDSFESAQSFVDSFGLVVPLDSLYIVKAVKFIEQKH